MAKWDAEILAALTAAGKPLLAGEIRNAIIGPPPVKQFSVVSNAIGDAARRGIIRRIPGPGGAGRTWLYTLINAEAHS